MSYAKSVLQPGEKIITSGRLHWIIYGWAIACAAAGLVLLILEFAYMNHQRLIWVTFLVFAVLSLAMFCYGWFIRWITEFAVTDRRVISKRGFIWRETEEMNMDKVETVDIDQSILGRVLNYGTIQLTGTGGTSNVNVHRIADPFALRSAIIAK
jgi:uncharacterized membrane protein YdbT with pleckstrin-like domain